VDIQLTAVDARTGRRQDVVLVVEQHSTVADAERALRSALGVEAAHLAAVGRYARPTAPGGGAGVWVAGRPVDPELAIGVSPLREGAVVGLDGPVGPGVHDLDVGGVAEVRVVGGPDAGRVHRLPLGEYVLGSAHDADAAVDDPTVSARQARVLVTPSGVQWTPFDQAAAALVEGKKIDAERQLRYGRVVAVGNTRLMVVPAEAPDAALVPSEDGGLAYNRPPRLPPPPTATRIEMPTEPKDAAKRPIPVLASLAPLAFGALMFAVTQNAMFLMFTLLSPVMLISNVISERRQGRKSHRQQLIDYRKALAEARKRLTRAAALERELRRYDSPDPATVLVTALGPRRRLWERRRFDQDRMRIRLGLARLRAEIEVTGGSKEDNPEPPMLDDVPVTVALGDAGGVLGVAGPHTQVHATARWLVAQAAVLHSPRDLSIVVLANEHGERDWSWTRWLPHARPAVRDCTALTGSTMEVTARRVAELAGLVQQRQAQITGLDRRLDLSRTTVTLVVLDGARQLRSLPGMPQVLQDGPAVGVYAICLDAEQRLLPEECGVVASYLPGDPTRMTVRRAFGETVENLLADSVSVAWAERVARAMTAIRDVSRDEGDAGLPHSLRLLDVLELEPPTTDAVLGWWDRGGRTTYAPIGAAADGRFAIDLKKDGPHALVAGTTGAGKSELLQTIIASLTVANRPDAMTFVLIDYKGGAAFKDCIHLPHTVGMVTDLDGHLTERALQSLNAELKRREQLLSTHRAKDIEDYWDTLPTHPTPDPDPLPRLILIIDEFASLVEELPDFVTGLVGIATRGRSLGIHLILATQRPSGVVSPTIRANTNLRIALRVTDDTESTDVIDARDSARINKANPGRGYLRVVGGTPVEFQTARVGGRTIRSAAEPPTVTPAPWRTLGASEPLVADDRYEDGPTDLQRLVSVISAAAARRGLGPPPSPWLPPLPALVTVQDLDRHPAAVAGPDPSEGSEQHLVPLGLADHPAEQRQDVFGLDLGGGGGSLLVAGGPRSGRSTALRTLAGSVARLCRVDDVHLYALDCGGGALHLLAALPHCGAVVRREEVARGDRVLARLLDEVRRRQELLAQAGYGSIAELRTVTAPSARPPWLLLLLDGWEGFTTGYEAVDHGRPVDTLLTLAREGPAVGLKLAVTSDRQGLLTRLGTAFPEKLLLRLTDRLDYGLAGIPTRAVPETMPAGRGLLATGAVEVQVALLDRDPTGPAQAVALSGIAAAATDRATTEPPRSRPFRVLSLPRLVRLADLEHTGRSDPPTRPTCGAAAAMSRGDLGVAGDPPAAPAQLAVVDRPLQAPTWTLVGAGGDDAGPIGVDLAGDGPGFLVAGPRRSGRSTTLITLARGLRSRGMPVVLVAPARSPLESLVDGGMDPPAVLGPGDGRALSAALAKPPGVVLVDDVTAFTDSAVDQILVDLMRAGGDGHVVVAAGRNDELAATFRGAAAEVRRSRAGLLLCPNWTDGELLGVRLPRGDPETAPGRGVLVSGGRQTPVQVAVATAGPAAESD